MEQSSISSPCCVRLVANTPEPDRVVALSASLCYEGTSAGALFDVPFTPEKARTLIGHLRRSGHHSVFEHVSFSFAVEGISRVCSHQLVRHRIASFTQQSQRYVRMENPEMILPPSIASHEDAKRLFEETVENAHRAYGALCAMGIPQEDARFVLPHGWGTQLMVTMNGRELHHFFQLRLCRRAQWEIRALALKMLRLARDAAPLLFEVAGPGCVVGRCEEERPCGRPFRSSEELIADVDA